MKRRALFVFAAGVVATTAIAACSLRDTSYLQAGGATVPPSEAGPDTTPPGTDGSTATHTATVLAQNLLAPSLLTQDAQSLYWVTSDGTVMAIKKDGSEASPRTVTAAGQGVTALATADGAELFYTKGTEVFTVPKAGGNAAAIGTTTPPPRALAIDPAFVFAMAEDDNAADEPGLYRFQHDGGAPTVLRRASESLFMYAIAVQGNDVFWDEGEGTFFSLPKDAVADAGPMRYEGKGGPSGSIESALYANGFAVDESAFFYSDGTNVRTHARAPSSTANTAIAYAADTTSVTAVAIDDKYVYAIETGAAGTLRRNTKDAKGTPELMLDGLATPSSLAVDANAVYLALEGPPGAIVKTTK